MVTPCADQNRKDARQDQERYARLQSLMRSGQSDEVIAARGALVRDCAVANHKNVESVHRRNIRNFWSAVGGGRTAAR